LEQFYVTKQLAKTTDPEVGVKRVAILALNSPRFLYRELGSPLSAARTSAAAENSPRNPGGAIRDSYDVASRLSFGLWDSLPDDELMRAAASGKLNTRDDIAKQAERMVTDPRAWSKLRS